MIRILRHRLRHFAARCGLSLRPNWPLVVHALVVVLGIVLIWRGVWNLLDHYFLPSHPLASNLVGITIGMLLLYLPDRDLEELE